MSKPAADAPGPARKGVDANKAARLERRAQALRDNLKRRKEQDRARKSDPKPNG